MAEKRVQLTVEPDTYTRLVGRAATEGCTLQNVVVAACRGYVGEHQRERVGHGRRPETMIGGPAQGARPSGPTTLDLKIGVNTCGRLEARAGRDAVTLHTTITRALREWLGMAREPNTAAPGSCGNSAGTRPQQPE